MSLSLLPDETPDEIDLELRLLGQPMDDAVAARIDQAASSELAMFRDELEHMKQIFAREKRPLQPARIRWWAAVPATALALAAAVLLLIRLFSGTPEGIRSMGADLPVDLTVMRSDGSVATRGFLSGDRLFVALVSQEPGWLNVGVVQEDGEATGLLSGRDRAVGAAETIRVEGAIEIDAYEGREWLVIYVSPKPLSGDAWVSRLSGALPDPGDLTGRRWFVREITRTP